MSCTSEKHSHDLNKNLKTEYEKSIHTTCMLMFIVASTVVGTVASCKKPLSLNPLARAFLCGVCMFSLVGLG